MLLNRVIFPSFRLIQQSYLLQDNLTIVHRYPSFSTLPSAPLLPSMPQTPSLPQQTRFYSSGFERMSTLGLVDRQMVGQAFSTRKKASGGGKGGRSEANEGAKGGDNHQAELDGLSTEAKLAMRKSIEFLENALISLRTKATPGILDSVRVKLATQEVVPLSKLALITQKDTGALRVALYDPSHIRQVEKAILDTPDLELTPQIEGGQIHITVPKPTAELRQMLVKKAGEKAEQAKQSLRNARQKALAGLKRLSKDLSKDEIRQWENMIQNMIDEHTKLVTNMIKAKEKELQQ